MDRIEYDGATGVLEVELHGDLYRFSRVPIELYERLRLSPEPEQLFEREIHHRFPYEHVARTLPADL